MTDPPYTFNLWTEPWIRVTRNDGSGTELGIGACLAEAHELVGLHDPSPLVAAGTHRLLTAILQAIYAPKDLGEITALLNVGQFDPARLEQFATQHAERFDMFHPTAPFLQTGDVPLDGWKKPEKDAPKDIKDAWVEPSSVATLFAEIPSASNRSHFHHVTDESHYLCPACCARGLVAVPAFARAEGGGPEGYRPAITGGPPIYITPVGDTLFQSLTLSLVVPAHMPRKADPSRSQVAVWDTELIVPRKHEVSSIGYIESLVFPVRRIRLYPLARVTNCTHCGFQAMVTVQDAYFKMGMSLSKSFGVWDDPFVALQNPKRQSDKEPYPVQPQAGKDLWREYSGLLLAEHEGRIRPRIVRQIANLIDRGALSEEQIVRFRCVGLRADQAKVEAWYDESLDAPRGLLINPEASFNVETAIDRANQVERIINDSFNRHFKPQGRKSEYVRFKTVRARMTADYWRRLAPLFRRFVFDLTNVEAREATERGWADTVIREGQQAFKDAADQIGERADALRARVEAQAMCSRRLAGKRKEWFSE